MPRAFRSLLVWGILLPAGLPAAARAADPTAAAAAILRELPPAGDSREAEWIYDRARSLSDADVALALMQAAADRGGEAGVRARLWCVRYWATAGEGARACEELAALGDLPAGSAPRAEADYWTLRLQGGAASGGVGGADAGLPPWHLLTALAALAHTAPVDWSVSAALSLEGGCRRWGLLGPWLWQLLRSPDAQLRRAAEQIARSQRAALTAAPEGARIGAVLQAGGADRVGAEVSPGPPPQPSGTATERRYAVQIGSYADQRIAEELLRELATHGFEGHLTIALPPGHPPVHRVRLGPHADLAGAESLGVTLSRELMLPYQVVEIP